MLVAIAAALPRPALPAQAPLPLRAHHADQSQIIESLVVSARFENAGTSEMTTSVRVRVQSEAGVRFFGQLVFPYSAAFQDVRIDQVRVHKASGSMVSVSAEAVQDVGGEVQQTAPVYTDEREKHVTVPSLRPGDVLEYRVTYRTHTALAPGHFWFEHEFGLGAVVLEERFELDIPAERMVNVKTRRGPQPAVTEQNGRRTYTWQTSNETPLSDEELVNLLRRGSAISGTTFGTWDEVAHWYDELQRDRIVPTDGIRKLASQLVADAQSARDTVEALYRYVAASVRYVSISLGLGRYQPHAASEVLANQYGDCKDKHTLLAALLAAVGRPAWPALVSTWREIDPDVPSPAQFDHLVTALPGPDERVWLDATTEVAPFGLVTANLRGKHALVVPPQAGGRLEMVPLEPPIATFSRLEFDGRVSDLGGLSGTVSYGLRGDWEVLVRVLFRTAPKNQWEEVAQGFAQASGFGDQVRNVQVGDPEETSRPFELSFRINQAEYVDWDTKRVPFRVPLPSMDLLYEEPGAADSTIRLDGWDNVHRRAVVALPSGVQVKTPVPVRVRRDWAEFRSEYQVRGDTVTVERTLTLKQRALPRAKAQEVEAFLRAIRADEQQTISVEVTGKLIAPLAEDPAVEDLNAAGYAALERDDFERAVELLSQVVEKQPQHAHAWNNLGRAHMGRRDLDRAITAFRRQIELNAFDEYAYNNLGLALRRQRKHEEAIASFRRQIEVSPLDRYAHANLGSLYLDLDRNQEAAAVLETAARIDPENRSIQHDLGKAYLRLGRAAEAGVAFERFLTDETSTGGYLALAQEVLEHRELAPYAERWAETAVRRMSASLRELDLSSQTTEELRDPLERSAELAYAWELLGRAAWRAGELSRAERYLAAAWLATLGDEVGFELARVYEAQGRKADAARQYAAVIAETRGDLDDSAGVRLVALAGGRSEAEAAVGRARTVGAQLRTARIPGAAGEDLELSLILVLGEGGRVIEVKQLGVARRAAELVAAIRSAALPVKVPADYPVRVLRPATLYCSKHNPGCDLVMSGRFGGVPRPSAALRSVASDRPSRDRVCEVPMSDAELPSVGAVMDSAAAHTALETAARDASGFVLLALRFESPGTPLSARIIQGDSGAVGSHVRAEVTVRLLPQHDLGEPGGVRLRVWLGSDFRFAIEPSVYCQPQRASSGGSRVGRTLRGEDLRRMENAGPVTVRLHVDEQGRVVKTEIVKSSGVQGLDEMMAAMASDDRFHPALLDGRPVPATTEITSGFRSTPVRR